MNKNQNSKPINKDLTASFDSIVSITKGSQQMLTDLDGNMYLSFYTNSLLWSCGYNNPTINRDVNKAIKKCQDENKPIDINALLSETSKKLHPHLSKKIPSIHYDSDSLYPKILSALLTKRNKTEFLCLEKKPGYFPKLFEDKIFSFKDWIGDDPKANTDAIENTVFPELKTIRFILRKHKSTLAGCIIDPFLASDASLAKKEKLVPVLNLLSKYNIPIIWDESIAGFHRMGPVFSYKIYDAQPNVLIYDGLLYNDRSIHFAAVSKPIKKLLLNQELLVKPQDIPNFVMFNALQNFIDTSDFTKKTQALGTRMIGKLRALEANSGKKFTIKGKGLTLFINFKTEKLCDGFITFMRTKGILVKKFDARPEFVLIYPPLILTEKNIDEIVENFKKFFNQPA